MAGVTLGWMRYMLGLDTGAFDRGAASAERRLGSMAGKFDRAGTRFGALGKSLGGLTTGIASALTIGALTRLIQGGLEYAGSLAEVAQQLGVTAKDLQVFRYAAGQVGVSQEQLETGLSKLTITLGKVAAGAKAPAAALAAIGVSASQLKGKDTGEAFRIIADGLQKVTDRSQRAAVEVALFGKAGAMLDNLLSGGSTALNELSAAAEKLGIVLSDEQIQKADSTADKLEALKTVLSANIAGAVADNADSVLALGDALASLVRSTGEAVTGLRILWNEFKALGAVSVGNFAGASGFLEAAAAAREGGIAFGTGSVTMKLPPIKAKTTAKSGADIGKFLAGGGGGSKHKGAADHSAENALRDAHQFDDALRRAHMDVLQALQDLSKDYVERTTIGIEILNAEKAAFDAEQRYQVALFSLSKGKEGMSAEQAKQLKAEYDKTDALRRQALLEEEQAQRREDTAMLIQTDFDIQKDKLQSELQLATTAKEQRAIQLRLLDLSYRQERARLEAILADEKASEAAKEDARRRLLGLNHTYGNDRQNVVNQTQGPLDQYFSQVPKNAAEAQAAMERLQVMGIDGAINSILALADGFQSFRDTALSAVKQVIAELLRMQLLKLALNLFGKGTSLPISGARAAGGPVAANMAYLVGERGPEIFMPSGGGRILSNSDSRSAARGGDWRAPQVAMTVYARDADSFHRSDRQITRSLQRRLR